MSTRRSSCPDVSGLASLPESRSVCCSPPSRRPPAETEHRRPRRPTCASRRPRTTSVSLAWDASTDNSSSFWYCVQTERRRVHPGRPAADDGDAARSCCPSATHTFSVFAIDAAGNRSANSNTVSFTTPPDTRPPSPPPTLSVTSVSPTTVSLAWTAVGRRHQPGVDVAVRQRQRRASSIGSGRRTSRCANLTPETTYEFQVTVRDASGNVAESNVLAVTTPAVTDCSRRRLPPTSGARPRATRSTSSCCGPNRPTTPTRRRRSAT